MSGSLGNSSVAMALLVIPSEVIWSYISFGVVLAIGLVAIFLRGNWQKARGLDKVITFGPLFYAAPLAAFGTEHFTLTKDIASLIPTWIPWHLVWAYFVGACFIAAALSLVTGIQSAPLGEFARLDVLPFRSADGCPRLGTQSAKSVCAGVNAAGIILQRRPSGAGSQP